MEGLATAERNRQGEGQGNASRQPADNSSSHVTPSLGIPLAPQCPRLASGPRSQLFGGEGSPRPRALPSTNVTLSMSPTCEEQRGITWNTCSRFYLVEFFPSSTPTHKNPSLHEATQVLVQSSEVLQQGVLSPPPPAGTALGPVASSLRRGTGSQLAHWRRSVDWSQAREGFGSGPGAPRASTSEPGPLQRA